MKIIISILLLSALVVCNSYAERPEDALRRGKGPMPSGTIRQEPFPDLFGHPVIKYTNDGGGTSVIRQKPYPDLFGNPAYDVKQES